MESMSTNTLTAPDIDSKAPTTSTITTTKTSENPEEWIYIAPSSSFPEIPPTPGNPNKGTKIAPPPPDPWDEPSESPPPAPPACKIFQLLSSRSAVEELSLSEAQFKVSFPSEMQILMFRFRGKVWAVDHACPHRRAALSRGRLVDLEDAGNVVGVVCAVHGWAFELEGGMGSRGVSVGVWDVKEDEGGGVWVRRKARG